MFPIVVENNLGEKELMALNKIVLNKNRWLMPVMIAIIAVCGLLIYLVERQITAELIWCACVVVLCTLWVYVFAPLITKHSVKKQQARLGERRVTAEIYEDRFHFTVSGDNFNGDETVNFSSLLSVTETDEYFFAFFHKLAAHIIDKSNLSPDEIGTVRVVLQNAVAPKKYKMRCKP